MNRTLCQTARYRGAIVRIRELRFDRKKDIPRDMMKEMKLMRELRHDNINRSVREQGADVMITMFGGSETSPPQTSIFWIILFLSSNLLTGMTGISLIVASLSLSTEIVVLYFFTDGIMDCLAELHNISN
jgi:hypothetical protein